MGAERNGFLHNGMLSPIGAGPAAFATSPAFHPVPDDQWPICRRSAPIAHVIDIIVVVQQCVIVVVVIIAAFGGQSGFSIKGLLTSFKSKQQLSLSTI